MDTTVWRFIKWDSGSRQTLCCDCFEKELMPSILYYHYPDTRWIKTHKGSFMIYALGIEQLGSRRNVFHQSPCSICGKIRRNDFYISGNQPQVSRKR